MISADGRSGSMGATRILFVCTGNICRSPMAEYMTRAITGERGLDVLVRSAGLAGEGQPSPGYALDVMEARGIDISGHRSRRLSAMMVRSADLVVGMAGNHVREAAVLAMDRAARIGTLRELARLAERRGPRASDMGVPEWIESLTRDRPVGQIGLGGAGDDIEDPYKRRRKFYERTATEIEQSLLPLLDLMFPSATGLSDSRFTAGEG